MIGLHTIRQPPTLIDAKSHNNYTSLRYWIALVFLLHVFSVSEIHDITDMRGSILLLHLPTYFPCFPDENVGKV